MAKAKEMAILWILLSQYDVDALSSQPEQPKKKTLFTDYVIVFSDVLNVLLRLAFVSIDYSDKTIFIV